MSAETLRRAAALMRERAEAATPGRWVPFGTSIGAEVGECTCHGPTELYAHEQYCGLEGPVIQGCEADIQHVASWHPTVALAVADWLDDTATTHRSEVDEVAREDCERCGPDDDCKGHDEECCWYCVGQWEEYAVRVFYPCREMKAALAVALAYLGEHP